MSQVKGIAAAKLHPRFKDITGQKFGRWTVVRYIPMAERRHRWRQWLCRCECGVERAKWGGGLRQRIRRWPNMGCRSCAGLDRVIPDDQRKCRWCGRPTTGSPSDECSGCNRASYRNGIHLCCGAPVYKTRPHTCPQDAHDRR